jgi:hypothetical protein
MPEIDSNSCHFFDYKIPNLDKNILVLKKDDTYYYNINTIGNCIEYKDKHTLRKFFQKKLPEKLYSSIFCPFFYLVKLDDLKLLLDDNIKLKYKSNLKIITTELSEMEQQK